MLIGRGMDVGCCAYKNREPAPYCEDTGQAQTTCKGSPVQFVISRAGISYGAVIAGIVANVLLHTLPKSIARSQN